VNFTIFSSKVRNLEDETRVARWFIFKQKNQYLGQFRSALQRKMLVNLRPFRLFHCRLEYVMAVRYILWPFWVYFPVLVYFSRLGVLYQEKSGSPVPNHRDFVSHVAPTCDWFLLGWRAFSVLQRLC
jgi:hypothetical protein